MATNDTNPTPAEQEQKEFITAAAANLWGSMNLTQLKQLLAAHKTGDLEQDFISIIGEIAQKAQEHPAGHEVQEDIAKMPGYRPELDPESPEFNIEAYKAAVEQAGGFSALEEEITAKFLDATQPTADAAANALTGEPLRQTLEAIEGNPARPTLFALIGESAAAPLIGAAQAAQKAITALMKSDTYKTIIENLQAIAAYIEKHKAEFEAAGDKDLAPFLKMELEAAKTNPEFADVTLADIFLQGIDADGNPTDSKFKGLIERAKQRRAEYEATEEQITEIEKAAEELPRIIANPSDKVNYPLDKPNSVIWSLITDAAKNNPDGQMQLAIDTSKKGSKQDAVILYSINFDELPAEITKHLTQFDKRVYIAAAALYNAGNKIISTTQIYHMMGNSGRPNADDKKKIDDSLTKMGAARIYLDNTQEVQQTKGYKLFKYDAPLLPFERISAYINGQFTESAIHLYREPPLISFARQRNQITTIDRQLLESPVNKTDANLMIDDYLLERIGHMKSGKGKTPRKILFATLFDRCNIKTTKQKQRAPEKIRKYLDHYKKCGWIDDYTESADGITVIV